MAVVPAARSVVAHNADTASENRIHDDSVARRYGFGGGLVPGVTLWAYMAHVPAALWGPAWLERGTMSARFVKPVYDGDRVEITAVPAEPGDGSGAGDGPAVVLALVGPDGEARATGEASLPGAPRPAPPPGEHHDRPLPGERPAADERSLAPGTVLGTVAGSYHAGAAPAFLDEIHEDLDAFAGGALAHPGWLIRFANAAVAANVALGPSIHVESAATHLGSVTDGTELRFRSRVADEYERHGHRYAVVDGLLVDVTEPGERPVMHVRHRVIYQLRG